MHIYTSTNPKIQIKLMSFYYYFLQIFPLLTILFHQPATSHAAKRVDSLPGYSGKLPFSLETGYIGVGEEEEAQLFYYFIESERDPKTDPLLVWLSGGPGCSSFNGLVSETGPIRFINSAESWESEIPYIRLNPYSWTKVSSMIFVDSPVGAGFSYAATSKLFYTDDIRASKLVYDFLKKWLQEHVEFQNNSFYVSGDSYSGIPIPVLVQEILNGNKDATRPIINLKGYTLGNPLTVREAKLGSRYKYAHRVSLLSDELYKATKVSCHGNYENVDETNTKCRGNLQSISRALDPLKDDDILEIKCNISSSISPLLCRDRSHNLLNIWANNQKVQEALHIREGTKPLWYRCNRTQEFFQVYEENVLSSFDYHLNFTKESLHALIYSGDQDMSISYVDSLAWIAKLKLPVIDHWRPWFVKGQVAGYTMMHSNGHYHLTFATVKGAGHIAPEYKPQECQLLFTKWFTGHSLE